MLKFQGLSYFFYNRFPRVPASLTIQKQKFFIPFVNLKVKNIKNKKIFREKIINNLLLKKI